MGGLQGPNPHAMMQQQMNPQLMQLIMQLARMGGGMPPMGG